VKFTLITPIVDVPLGSGRPHFFLKDCIESVVGQIHQDWEWLIGSDGPLPRAKALIDGFKDDRIRFVEFERKGLWGNPQRNVLIEQAKGELIGFLDHDDCLFANSLSRADEYARLYPHRPLFFSIEMPHHYTMEPRMQFGSLAGSMLICPKELIGRFTPEDGYSADYECIQQTLANAKYAGVEPIFSKAIINRSRPWWLKAVTAEGYKEVTICHWT